MHRSVLLHWLIEAFIVILGVDIGQALTERIVADVYCTGDTIVEFITSSPLYMQKTSIALVPGYTAKFYIILTWTPTAEQYGPQVERNERTVITNV